MEPSNEWGMVEELFEIHDELSEDAEDFILNLHEHIDPYSPFFEQLIGLPDGMERQMKWLYSLYEKYCNHDQDAGNEVWEDE